MTTTPIRPGALPGSRSGQAGSGLHVPAHPVRFVTAASLFDGHDAAITIMRRILTAQGAEVIHLGHDRSVAEIVDAAVQEDVAGVAVSSYQGGHLEFFGYLVERLRERGAGHVQVYGGGGGVILAEEAEILHQQGVRKIFRPEDGQRLGLPGMVNTMIADCDVDLALAPPDPAAVLAGDQAALARAITVIEAGKADPGLLGALHAAAATRPVPVLGVTGTGGSGKSSLTDELVRRLRVDQADRLRIAVLAVDPTRHRGGGALLGDRIRMNALSTSRTYFRSLATRGSTSELPAYLPDVVAAVKAAGYDLVIVETPGIGQGDAAVEDLADVALYVMTPEFGAATQLEKIAMLDAADVVAINKFERRGAEDALRDVGRQLVRNREAFGAAWGEMPVFGTSAARFDDDGVTALYQHLRGLLAAQGLPATAGILPAVSGKTSTGLRASIPPDRVDYLARIAGGVRDYHRRTGELAAAARTRQHLGTARSLVEGRTATAEALDPLIEAATAALGPDTLALIESWPATVQRYRQDSLGYEVRGRHLAVPLVRTSLSGTRIPRVALPALARDGGRDADHAGLVRYLRGENLPGEFPYTAGVFPLKLDTESATRMFAGEGDPARTNRRFHLLCAGQPATRLSTAFDSVTLYGRDPDERPDIYGKVGTSGVSVATVEDMRTLFAGFDLCSPSTSVSMTINGPAPAVLAMFLNAAIDQQLEAFATEHGRTTTETEAAEVRARTLRTVRGTVQADILKEDQGQNTCILSTEFALRCMADVQQWFVDHEVRSFYSASVSGYHIAEAGANPISQLAFTLANGFTYVESYLARGMTVEQFAPNLSFFFSNGMDPEYTVLGRVARRIWAIALRDRYGSGERAAKLKYHVQTSGRSLHAQEMDFNDIRTTLQALCAIYDNANSLHTNAYDEAVTTPGEHSVRRAVAIQLIIEHEWGLAGCENPLQGSFVVEELTDLVEEAVLAEFEQLSRRGGVLGAMETGYQRGRIQDESMLYEQRKHDGSLPIIGVNTFLDPHPDPAPRTPALARGTEEEKRGQLRRLREFQARHEQAAPAMLRRLRETAATDGNLFAVLMDAVRVCTLGQISQAFFEAGGQYRRSM